MIGTWILSAVVSLAVAQAPPAPGSPKVPPPPPPVVASDRAPGLYPVNLYNGVNRPALIDVVSPRSFGTVSLVLMDIQGKPIAEPVEVRPGRVDLAEKMPAIWTIRRTSYLQMISNEESVGAALVMQPLLSRMVPVMEPAKRANGSSYMRIGKWVDENQPVVPAAPVVTTPPATTQPDDEASGGAGAVPIPRDDPKPVERLFTGLRMYIEQDVILHTTQGDIRIALRPDEAPNTAWNFLELSRGGWFRDIQFHRIVPLTAQGQPFVIQAGDPTATGDGGAGYWLPIEDSQLPHDFGVISMARSDDPDSAGSQIFICLSRLGTARLDGQYCSFGYAVSGADVIKAIAAVPLADVEAGRPADPVPLIKTAEVVSAPARLPGTGRPDQSVSPNDDDKPFEPKPNRVPR